jgi:hypothetical protein
MNAARRWLLLANGVFLVVVGGVQVVFELLAYYAGAGPYGYVFAESRYAIGWVEAHGLACIIGVLLLTVAARDGRRFWHVLAAAVHFVFVVAHVAAFVVSRERTSA